MTDLEGMMMVVMMTQHNKLNVIKSEAARIFTMFLKGDAEELQQCVQKCPMEVLQVKKERAEEEQRERHRGRGKERQTKTNTDSRKEK